MKFFFLDVGTFSILGLVSVVKIGEQSCSRIERLFEHWFLAASIARQSKRRAVSRD